MAKHAYNMKKYQLWDLDHLPLKHNMHKNLTKWKSLSYLDSILFFLPLDFGNLALNVDKSRGHRMMCTWMKMHWCSSHKWHRINSKNSMMLMGIHFMTANHYLSNLKRYATKSINSNNLDRTFKQERKQSDDRYLNSHDNKSNWQKTLNRRSPVRFQIYSLYFNCTFRSD